MRRRGGGGGRENARWQILISARKGGNRGFLRAACPGMIDKKGG